MQPLNQYCHIPRAITLNKQQTSTLMWWIIREHRVPWLRKRWRWSNQCYISWMISWRRTESRRQGSSLCHLQGCPLNWQIPTHILASFTIKRPIKKAMRTLHSRLTTPTFMSNSSRSQTTPRQPPWTWRATPSPTSQTWPPPSPTWSFRGSKV